MISSKYIVAFWALLCMLSKACTTHYNVMCWKEEKCCIRMGVLMYETDTGD
ncbi:hypothetical protein PVAP13_3NG305806 [Panicum virgatum]|uniref:Uncharacterized protein n=1 Tax=Panicum virgatum TaxID=38727 RepID=A0A8T0UCQ3_PANVG|nr:hypothetical protein PVAP13_3NG305806 [Panicum virgatum]